MSSSAPASMPQRRVVQDNNTMTRKPRGFSRVRYWFNNHIRACVLSLGELIRAPIASAMMILVIGIAMAFPAGLYILLRDFADIAHQWHSKPTISLYLQAGITADRVAALTTLLQQRDDVESVSYISPEQGLTDFMNQTQLGDVLKVLPTNPLPGILVVTPKPGFQTPTAMNLLLSQVKSLDGVDTPRLDMAWIQRLQNLVTLAKRVTFSVGILLSIGVVLIVGNTIRLATQNRQQEIVVMQLVGATNAYIRRPFLYRGIWYGLTGGVIAWLLVMMLVISLQGPAQQLVPDYAQSSLWSLLHTFDVGFFIVLISTLLSLVGSWIVVNQYLRSERVPK